MSSRRDASVLGLALAAATSNGCASVVGLDELVYDREDGAGGAATTSTGAGTGGAGGQGEGAGGPLVVTGSSEGYAFLIKSYDASFYRLDTVAYGDPVLDSGMQWYGGFVYDSESDISLEQPGVFSNNSAVTFRTGGAVTVYRDNEGDITPYMFLFADDDEGAFTISFFAKLEATPADTIVFASCFDNALLLGWQIILDDGGIVFTRYGEDAGGGPAAENTPSMPFPTDGGWHLVTVQKLSGGPTQNLRGFIDGEKLFDVPSDVRRMVEHNGDLLLGGDPEEAFAPAITLDEMVIAPYGLNDAQLAVQLECLQGGSCEPPPVE